MFALIVDTIPISFQICDEKLRITNVNPRFPGSTHDAHIWHNSNISQVMEQLYRNDANNVFYLLGDSGIFSFSHTIFRSSKRVVSGYPLRPWLLTPLLDVEENTPEERFNNSFKRLRSLIEQCNGLLKARFRCLLKHRVLHYLPTKAANIVNACAVLHNMCIENNDVVDDVDANIEDLHMYPYVPQNEIYFPGHPDLAAAKQIQHNLVVTMFTE
ncbi:hypothetical protein MML48_2g00006749 [Holotrichia oblita]|uniref:Uncharacterized protein n=1 Tax=Holotrichia oblita TaxID=644536 RepID=A0ACB9TKJ5_HOLOL|nr:hypothetical protein MML48_2g00006749 [Holotrichia oblita]